MQRPGRSDSFPVHREMPVGVRHWQQSLSITCKQRLETQLWAVKLAGGLPLMGHGLLEPEKWQPQKLQSEWYRGVISFVS